MIYLSNKFLLLSRSSAKEPRLKVITLMSFLLFRSKSNQTQAYQTKF